MDKHLLNWRLGRGLPDALLPVLDIDAVAGGSGEAAAVKVVPMRNEG